MMNVNNPYVLLPSLLLCGLLLTPLLGHAAAQHIDQNTFATVDEYPYKFIVRLADHVQIRYSQADPQTIQCQAEITYNSQYLISSQITVKKAKFAKDAFKSCLAREEAKTLLSKIFATQ